MRNHDKALEQVRRHHVVRMNVEDETMVTRSYAHFQTDIVRQIEWRLENGGSEGAEGFLPQHSSGNAGGEHDVPGKAACE